MKYVSLLFFLFCLFPYIDIINIGTDTQPNALLLGALILFGTKDKLFNRPLVLLWVLFLVSPLLYFGNSLGFFDFAKACFNYMSPAIVATTAYVIFTKSNYRFPFSWFVGILIVYMIVGLIQMYIREDFGVALLNEGRGILYYGRGVISLSPEPAFYGTLCLFFVVFSLLHYTPRQNWFSLPLIFFQLLYLSRSATAIGLLLVSVGTFILIQIIRFKIRYLFYGMLIVLVSVPIINSQVDKLNETRAGRVALKVLEDPSSFVRIDNSVGSRYISSIAPYLLLKHKYFVPQGLGNYQDFLRELYQQGKYRSMLNPTVINENKRITGSINVTLFQLGFIGLLLPIAIIMSFWKRIHTDVGMFCLVLYMSTLFTQIQLMHCMLGLVLAAAMLDNVQTSTEKQTIPQS